MILINLLPHREEKRRLRKQAFFAGLGLAVGVGGLLVAGGYAVQQQMISNQQARNDYLVAANRKLDEEIKDVSALKAEIESLKARQRAVEDLQTNRNMPVYLLNELVAQTPEGIYLSSIRQDGRTVMVTGMAQTNERVSEFLRNTGNRSTWLERPELQEIKVSAVAQKDARNPKRLFEFSMRLTLKQPQDVAEAAGGASAPAGAKGRKAPGRPPLAPVAAPQS
ncbi:PilN domain-containing protein [Aquabacterium sp.]|jgi:type IV pilus assembly protein PilN|uniref:PilN domain-containing protein n=1 Tax=Aquabacterium sp. TaxID=1872578 RepID=UPI002489E54A|nr:PilN domain-containing protein [Aquabacterium sp.]MDI1349518.1 PilN domain-containing protein [Aquabacterium sp.]